MFTYWSCSHALRASEFTTGSFGTSWHFIQVTSSNRKWSNDQSSNWFMSITRCRLTLWIKIAFMIFNMSSHKLHERYVNITILIGKRSCQHVNGSIKMFTHGKISSHKQLWSINVLAFLVCFFCVLLFAFSHASRHTHITWEIACCVNVFLAYFLIVTLCVTDTHGVLRRGFNRIPTRPNLLHRMWHFICILTRDGG